MNFNSNQTQGPKESEMSGEFRVHYHLRGNLHRIDAATRNKAESELLALLKEVSSILDVPFHVETQAYGEGGVVEYLNLVFQHKDQIACVMAILSPLLGAPFYLAKIKQTKQQTLLNELNLKKLKLEILEKEHASADRSGKQAHEGDNKPLALEPPHAPEAVAQALLAKKKISRRRSNYYETMINDSQIESVGFAPTHQMGAAERIVRRSEFDAFVITRADLEPLIYRRISVEIVSPVLKSGSIKWRGIVDKKIISFDLQDEGFRQRVCGKEVQFQNGTTLVCDLEVLQREDEIGEVEVTGYAVTTVHEVKGPADIVERMAEQLPLHLSEQPINEPPKDNDANHI